MPRRYHGCPGSIGGDELGENGGVWRMGSVRRFLAQALGVGRRLQSIQCNTALLYKGPKNDFGPLDNKDYKESSSLLTLDAFTLSLDNVRLRGMVRYVACKLARAARNSVTHHSRI